MNKSQYRAARAVIRANGNYGLRWLEGEVKEAMTKLVNQKSDKLRSRYIYCSAMEPICIKLEMVKLDLIYVKNFK